MPTAKERFQKAARNWVHESKNASLSPGERIKLFYRISEEAAQFATGKDAVPLEEIKEAFGNIHTNPTSDRTINSYAIVHYMKLKNLSKKAIKKLMQHASASEGHELTISHAIELAKITDEGKQLELLDQAISQRWGVRPLKDAIKSHLDNDSGQPRVRHKVLVGRIETAAADLNQLLTDFGHESFLKTIERSDRRSKNETMASLLRIDQLLKEIGAKVLESRDVARAAANKLSNVIQPKSD